MFDIEKNIYEINSEKDFEKLSLEIYKFQSIHNSVYKSFIKQLNRSNPKTIKDIPFLPISFFKTHNIRTNTFEIEQTFKSSGTGGDRSRHLVEKIELYHKSFEITFPKENLV